MSILDLWRPERRFLKAHHQIGLILNRTINWKARQKQEIGV